MASKKPKQTKQYVQTYQKRTSETDGPLALVPPKDDADWRLHSFTPDTATNGQYLIVVWEAEIEYPNSYGSGNVNY